MKWVKNKFIDFFILLSTSVRYRAISDLKKKGLLTVGEHSYGINNLIIDVYKGSEVQVDIGKFCSIGPNVRIITGGVHPVNWVSTYPFRIKWDLEKKYEDGMPSSKGNIIIGNDVWIGTGVTILSGVTIGHGAIVATNSVVTKNIPPYAIAGGIPAKIINYRFKEEIINDLLKISWWNWDKRKITEALDLLSSESVKKFILKYS